MYFIIRGRHARVHGGGFYGNERRCCVSDTFCRSTEQNLWCPRKHARGSFAPTFNSTSPEWYCNGRSCAFTSLWCSLACLSRCAFGADKNKKNNVKNIPWPQGRKEASKQGRSGQTTRQRATALQQTCNKASVAPAHSPAGLSRTHAHTHTHTHTHTCSENWRTVAIARSMCSRASPSSVPRYLSIRFFRYCSLGSWASNPPPPPPAAPAPWPPDDPSHNKETTRARKRGVPRPGRRVCCGAVDLRGGMCMYVRKSCIPFWRVSSPEET